MPLMVHIDTAGTRGLVAISSQGELLGYKENLEATSHASFVQPALQLLLQEHQLSLNQFAAISVANGPGSYTGLRVGLAAAKGLCFALNLPLITLNVLDLMAQSAVGIHLAALRCPMIDARRMEVFAALFHQDGTLLMPHGALLLEPDSYREWLDQGPVLFLGDGAAKWSAVCQHPNAIFQVKTDSLMAHIAQANGHLIRKQFADAIHAEPFYLKPFYQANIPTRTKT